MTERAIRELSILVENRFGVLFTIAGLFSARGYNIETLTVHPDRNPGLSRITMTVPCNTQLSEQIIKQLNKIIDVVEVEDLTLTTEESWQTSTTSSPA